MSYLKKKKKKEFARLRNLQGMIVLKVLFFFIVIFEAFNYFIRALLLRMCIWKIIINIYFSKTFSFYSSNDINNIKLWKLSSLDNTKFYLSFYFTIKKFKRCCSTNNIWELIFDLWSYSYVYLFTYLLWSTIINLNKIKKKESLRSTVPKFHT